MRRSGAWALVGAVLLVVGGVAGLLLAGPGGPGGGGGEGLCAEARDALVPTLTGARRARPAPEGEVGEFPLSGHVVDEHGAPAAGVPVQARRLAPATPAPSTVALLAPSFASELERCFAPPRPPETSTAAASTVSAADGSFALVVLESGRYRVAAEPQAPAGGDATYVTTGEAEATRLRLETWPGAALRGRVLDAEDRPVAATLVARHDAEGEDDRPTRSTSDPATGAFAFQGLQLGRTRLEVLVPGRLRFTGWRGALPATSEVIVRLGPEGLLLEGRITDPRGQPIEGARVAADVEETALPAGRSEVVDPRLLAVTDAVGVYRLRGAFTGTIERVLAWAPGHLGYLASPPEAPWSGLRVGPGATARLDLVLYRGGVLTGRVLEQGTRTPLAGAVVHVLPAVVDERAEKPQGTQATSDAAGHYRVEGLPVGRCVLAVEHPTHFLAAQAALRSGEGPGEWQLDWYEAAYSAFAPAMTVFLDQDGVAVEHDLELVRGLPVEGQVLDPDGRGVEGAAICWPGRELEGLRWGLGSWADAGSEALAVSGPEGRFRIGGLPPGEHWVLCARKEPWIGEHGEAFALRPGIPQPPLVLRLVRPAVLAGRVVDAAGAPVAGAEVSAYSRGEGEYDEPDASPRTWSGADGSFRLEGTPLGAVSVYAHADDHGYGDVEVEGLEPGSTRGDLRLTLEPSATAEVSGVLVLPSGLPARGKPLRLHSQDHPYESVETRGDGTFVGHAPAGPVSVKRKDTGAELAAVTAPASGLRLVYEPLATAQQVLEGLIVDPDGRPVPCCEVRITREEPRGGGSTFSSYDVTNVANGYFRRALDPPPPPLVLEVLHAQDGAGRPLNLRPARLTLAELPAAPLRIVLEPGAELRGRVVDEEGRGVEDARVGVGLVVARTDASGRFALGGLEDEEVSVSVLPSPPWARPEDRSATPGGEELAFVLTRGLALAGQVLDARRQPLRQVQVTVDWPTSPATARGDRRTSPDRSGRFRFEALPAGATLTVGVQPWSRSDAPSLPPVVLRDVRAGREDLCIVVPDAVAVEGTVVDAAGRRVRAGHVWAYDPVAGVEHDSLAVVAVSGEGTFRLAGLAPGPVLLQVSREDGGEEHVPLRVEAPATGVRLVLPPTRPIAGRLVGATDPAAFRAWAWAVEAEGRELTPVAIAADGTFALDAVGTGGRWMVAARADADDRYALEGPFEPGTTDVRLALRPGASLEGRVTTGDGAPLPDRITVSVFGLRLRASVEADDRGRWRLRGLLPGWYLVRASTPSSRYQDVEEPLVEAGRSGLTLVLPPTPPGSAGGLACGK